MAPFRRCCPLGTSSNRSLRFVNVHQFTARRFDLWKRRGLRTILWGIVFQNGLTVDWDPWLRYSRPLRLDLALSFGEAWVDLNTIQIGFNRLAES